MRKKNAFIFKNLAILVLLLCYVKIVRTCPAPVIKCDWEWKCRGKNLDSKKLKKKSFIPVLNFATFYSHFYSYKTKIHSISYIKTHRAAWSSFSHLSQHLFIPSLWKISNHLCSSHPSSDKKIETNVSSSLRHTR